MRQVVGDLRCDGRELSSDRELGRRGALTAAATFVLDGSIPQRRGAVPGWPVLRRDESHLRLSDG